MQITSTGVREGQVRPMVAGIGRHRKFGRLERVNRPESDRKWPGTKSDIGHIVPRVNP